MSTVFPKGDHWVGWSGGREILLRSDEAWDSEHPLVKERPDLFAPADPAPPVHRAPGNVAKKAAKAAPRDA